MGKAEHQVSGAGVRDYAVQVRVRNGRILSRMRAVGIASQAELARLAGVSQQTLNAIINLRKPPMRPNGEWYAGVEDIAGALRCAPEDMFSEAQQAMALRTNTTEVFMDEAAVAALATGSMEAGAWAKIEAERLLAGLLDRERQIVERRMDGDTLDAIAEDMNVTSNRIRQIEARAIQKLKAAAHRSEVAANRAMLLSAA